MKNNLMFNYKFKYIRVFYNYNTTNKQYTMYNYNYNVTKK